MSTEVTTAFVQQYTANVQMLLQQRGSKLRRAVTEDGYVGKAATVVEQIGKTKAEKRTSRHADTPLMNTPHDRPWVYPNDYNWADLIDNPDKLRMLIDPTSPYALGAAMALGRSIDDEIMGAFFGDRKTGENGSTTTSFDSNNVVAKSVGGSDTGLNVDKLRGAKRILMANEVDIEMDELFVAITAKEHDDLLGDTQAISLDYNTKPVLVDGKITAFMGFNFIHIELGSSDFDNASSFLDSTDRVLPCWARSGMHVGMWNDISGKITERADKNYSTQVYAEGTFGATRLEEGKVVKITCHGTT